MRRPTPPLEIVLADVEKYLSDQRARGAAAIVSELREYFDELVEAELAKRENELGELDEEQREKVRSLDTFGGRQDRPPANGGVKGGGRYRSRYSSQRGHPLTL